jgi:hypothetical protein
LKSDPISATSVGPFAKRCPMSTHQLDHASSSQTFGMVEETGVLTEAELDAVTGGAKNIDNPLVQTMFSAFNKTLAAGQAAVVEIARSSGGSLGSTKPF